MACAALSGRQGRRAARRDAGTSGKRLDAPGRPPAASRALTVVPATLFGPLLTDRAPGRDTGRDTGEKCGLGILCTEPVSRAAHGLDERAVGAGIDLAAEP